MSDNSEACVELRGDLDALRDSKNPAGPALAGIAVSSLVKWAASLPV